jgi:Flp pilus assembly protein TadD
LFPSDQSLPVVVWLARGRLKLAHGDVVGAMDCFKTATRSDPSSGEAHFWCAVCCMQQGLEPEALAHALEVERIKPGHPEMRTLIGVVRHHQNDIAGASAAFESALEVDSRSVNAHNSLAIICFQRQDWQGAERHFRALREIQPDSLFALSGHASSLAALGREAEAWPIFARVAELPGRTAQTCKDYAVALFEDGQLARARSEIETGLRLDSGEAWLHVGRANCELISNGSSSVGWSEYEWRFKLNPDRYRSRSATWAGDPKSAGRLLVYAEQGMGDVLLFARYLAPLSRSVGQIVLHVPPALGRLMRASAARFGWNISGWTESEARVDVRCDSEIPLLSLIHACGFPVERNRQAYLDVDDADKERWAHALGPRSPGRMRVGLVWAGNPKRREDNIRSILPEQLAPLKALKNVDFVSLQMDCNAAYRASLPFAAVDPTPGIRDFCDTAAIMRNLDLVLSIDTAAAHLAGALGVPCWVLLSKIPDWRWTMRGIEQPWYGTLRSFAVDRQRDWVPLMERVTDVLRRESGEA